MNTEHDHDPNEVRLAQILRSVDDSRSEPAAERLAQLRERSLQLFAETQLANDAAVKSDTHSSESLHAPATPAAKPQARPRMFTFAIRTVAAVAAGIVLLVGLFNYQSTAANEVPFSEVLANLREARSLELKVVREGQSATVFVRAPGLVRYEDSPQRYRITAGSRLWKIDETANTAEAGDSPWYLAPEKQIDLLGLLELGVSDVGPLLRANPRRVTTYDEQQALEYRVELPSKQGPLEVTAYAHPKTHQLLAIQARDPQAGNKSPLAELRLVAMNAPVADEKFTVSTTLTEDGRIGVVSDLQGIVVLRPMLAQRWTPLCRETILKPGDWLRTDLRGANAVRVRMTMGAELILGPGTLVEFISPTQARLHTGETQVNVPAPAKDQKPSEFELLAPRTGSRKFAKPGKIFVRIDKQEQLTELKEPPKWLAGFEGTAKNESLGSLIVNLPDGRNEPLTIGYHRVSVEIRDQIARTTIEESFVNHTASRLEGVFHFPLPQDASISGFGMWIGNELVEADVVEKQRAREIYETILRERRDPGLLEWTSGNLFKARVFPIEAHSEKRVKITYTQVLPLRGNKYRYNYGLRSDLLTMKPLRELALTVTVNSALPLKGITCTTHPARTQLTANSGTVEFAAQDYSPSRDFEVVCEVDNKQSEVVVVPHRRGDDGYLLVQLTPPGAEGNWQREILAEGAPLNLVLLCDTSGSMDSEKRRQQNEVVATILAALSPRDRFQLAVTDVRTDWANAEPQEATAENIKAARDYLDARISLGWTNLDIAYEAVFRKVKPGTQIIYIGDGIVTAGDRNPQSFVKRLAKLVTDTFEKKPETKPALHAITVGNTNDLTVLRGIAANGGSVRTVTGEQTPQLVATELLNELSQPGIRDLQVEFRGVKIAALYPERLPNIPAGTQQILVGRYLPEGRQQTGEIVVTGKRGNEAVRYAARINFADAETGNSFIPRLWGRGHLEHLLAQGTSPAIRDQIIALSEEFHIITPYTSLLVLESDADRERFGVKRRFEMRDGEKFFQDGKNNAQFELAQQQMKRAGEWRQNLRRNVLRQWANYGRNPQLQQRLAQLGQGRQNQQWEELRGWNTYTGSTVVTGGRLTLASSAPSDLMIDNFSTFDFEEETVAGQKSLHEYQRNERFAGDRLIVQEDESLSLDLGELHPEEPNAPAPLGAASTSASNKPMDASKRKANLESDAELMFSLSDLAPMNGEMFFDGGQLGKDQSRHNGFIDFDGDGIDESYYRMGGAGGGGFGGEFGVELKYDRRQQGRVDYTQWYRQLFPDLPVQLPAKQAADQATEAWPAEATALAKQLLRGEALRKLDKGLTIRRTDEAFDTVWKRRTSHHESLVLISAGKWLTKPLDPGTHCIIQTYDGKERVAYDRPLLLGQTRPAIAADQLPNLNLEDFSQQELNDSLHTFTAKVESPADGQKLLILTNAEGNYIRRFLIDTKRGVLLKTEDENAGKLNSVTTFTDFVERGGMWWAQTVRVSGPNEELYRETKFDIQELDSKKFDERFAAEQDQRDQVLFIKRPFPKLADVQKRIANGSADITDRMVQILAYCQTQQWDLLLEQLTALEKAADGKPGVRWIRTLVLSTIRRHEEARQRLQDEVKSLLAKPNRDDFYLAQTLREFMQSVNGVHEYLRELEALRPVYERMPAEIEAMPQYQEALATALENAGRIEESLEQRRLNREARPWDTYAQIDYARRLLNAGRADAAYAWLDKQREAEVKRTIYDRDLIFGGYAELYRMQFRWHDLVKLTTKWLELNTTNELAYQNHLSALVHDDQYDEANKLAEEWLQLALQPGKLSPGDEARFSTAANFAGGSIYYLSIQRMDPRWEKPLAELIRKLLPRADRISALGKLYAHYFTQTDSSDRLCGEMLELLKTKTSELTVPQIEFFLNQILNYRLALSEPIEGRRQFQAHELPAAFWQPIVRDLRTRWEKAEDKLGKNEKHTLGTLVQRIYALKFADSEYLPFLRERVKTAPAARVTEYRTTLFDTLLSRPWTLENENEAWDLLLVINNPQQPAMDQLIRVALLHRWVDAMLAARQQAALNAKQDEGKTLETTKQDLAKRQKEIREQAIKELAESLAKKTEALEKQQAPLAEWTRLETAWLRLQLDQQIDQAAELAWKLLDTADIKLTEKEDAPPAIKETVQVREQALLKQRALIMALRLASRKDAKPALVEQVLKYLDTRIAPKDESSNRWRMTKYQFLIARDQPEELERTLRVWIRESESTAPWRKSLALVLAELGKLDEAIKIFEALGADQQLSSADWRTLATWYTVGNRRTDQERATLAAWMAMPEQHLAQQLYQSRNRWQGHNGQPLPTEMDEATLQAIRALLSKAGNPENYFYQIRDLYQASRDFRVLKTVPRGILGHSPQQIYPYLTQVTQQLLSEIRNEAPADELLQEIKAARQEKLTTIDARALDLLEAMVERRASEVLNQRGPHVTAALAALQRAFERDWTNGEQVLMAGWLGNLGKLPDQQLKDEQLRELVALAKLVPDNSREQIRINREYYKLQYWHYDRKREAITEFTAALRAYEQTLDNKLPHEDNYLLQDLVSMLQDHGEHAAGEKLIVAHLPLAQHQIQREALQDMLWLLYNHALEHRGEVSLGKGKELLQELSKYGLARIDAEKTEQRRHDAVTRYVQTIDIARRNKIDGAEALLKTFLFEHMAKIMPRQSSHYSNTVQAPMGVSRELLGPVLTLQYGIERMEQWPRWMNLGWNNSWQSLGHEIAQQRHLAAEKKLDYSHLEERLLKLVVENLRHELRTGENRSGYMYHHGYAWREKYPVFLEVANEMHRELKSSGRRVVHIAGYLWDSLEKRTRAIEMLLQAEDDGILDLNGQLKLVEYLRYEKRHPETIVLLERLSKRYPDTMIYRAQLIEAYHFAKRPEKAKETLKATEEHFHAGGRWTEGNIATLASSLLTAEMTPRAAELFQEAITLRTRALNSRTLNDQTLSNWYQQLAHTYSRLKKTSAAVEAASAGILCWGSTHQHRTEAVSTLEQVLSQATDLPEYIKQLDTEAAKTGRDSPLLRKQLGKVLKQRAKYEDAVAQLRLAKELQPNDREVYQMLVECFDALQRPAEGTKELLARLDVDRHDLKLYEQLAERLRDDEAMSERALTNIIEAAPNEAENHQALAKIREKQKRWDEAIQHWQEVAELRRLEPTGLLGLAAAQIHGKHPDDARKTIEQLRKTEWPIRFNDAMRAIPDLERQLKK
jgi:predicted Zn-dependent protease